MEKKDQPPEQQPVKNELISRRTALAAAGGVVATFSLGAGAATAGQDDKKGDPPKSMPGVADQACPCDQDTSQEEEMSNGAAPPYAAYYFDLDACEGQCVLSLVQHDIGGALFPFLLTNVTQPIPSPGYRLTHLLQPNPYINKLRVELYSLAGKPWKFHYRIVRRILDVNDKDLQGDVIFEETVAGTPLPKEGNTKRHDRVIDIMKPMGFL